MSDQVGRPILSSKGESFLRGIQKLERPRRRSLLRAIRLLRRKLGTEWYEGSVANNMLLGWIGYMCDCCEVLLRSTRRGGGRDLAAAWLRPIVETSILMAWVGHDERRAHRVLVSQHRQWRREEKVSKGTIFEKTTPAAPPPPEWLKGVPGLPSTTDMAREVGAPQTIMFILESEALHPGAAVASAYVGQHDTDDVWAIQLRRPRERPARLTGVLGVALFCLLTAGRLLDERFDLGVGSPLVAMGESVGVGTEFHLDPDKEWQSIWA